MVELHSVPDGLTYCPSSFDAGFSHFPSFLGDAVKMEETLDHLLYGHGLGQDIDLPQDPSCSFLEPLRECSSSLPTGLLTPELTPPFDEVFHCMSPHGSLTMATEQLSLAAPRPMEEMLMPLVASPRLAIMSPPPVIHPVCDDIPPPCDKAVVQPVQGATKSTPRKPLMSSEDSSSPHQSRPPEPKRKKMSEPRKQRKREQNKLAALKYRNRKKQEKCGLEEQLSHLEVENAQLVDQVLAAEHELSCLKSMLNPAYN